MARATSHSPRPDIVAQQFPPPPTPLDVFLMKFEQLHEKERANSPSDMAIDHLPLLPPGEHMFPLRRPAVFW